MSWVRYSSKTRYYCISLSIDGNLELESIAFLFSYHIVDCLSYGAISHFIHLVIFKVYNLWEQRKIILKIAFPSVVLNQIFPWELLFLHILKWSLMIASFDKDKCHSWRWLWKEQDILTVDPARLELIGANEPSLMYGVQKLMASKELDNSSGCDSEMEPSITNTHCFFWWGAVKTSPTCTMTAATSNSLNKPNNNYWVYNFSLFTTRKENGGKAKTS